MDPVSLLQAGSALLLNAAFAWLAGSVLARYWLRGDDAPAGPLQAAMARLDLAAAGLAMLGCLAGLWAATAVMSGLPLRQAHTMLWAMLSGTEHGRAGGAAVGAMLLVAVVRLPGGSGRAGNVMTMGALMAFAMARAFMGHAGEAGLLSAVYAAEAVHYAAVGVWAGAVFVSGWLLLSPSHAVTLGHAAVNRYLARMSHCAMGAVAAIAGTGIFSAWHRVGTAELLVQTAYGAILLAKVGLVLLAIVLGGYNKFIGLPGASRSMDGVRAVRLVLQIETVALLGALLAASILVSQQPPATM